MGVELLWLLIPVLGLVIIAAFIVTIVLICRRRLKKDDGDDASSDVELQERGTQDDSVAEDGDPYNSQDVSFRRPEETTLNRDSIRVTSRRLPDLPVEGQTEEGQTEEETTPPVPPPPPPDVVSGGAEIRRDDAGTYDLLGADRAPLITDPDMEGPYAEGRGLSYPSPDLGGPTHTPPDVSPRVSINAKEDGEERNAVYSVINQLEKQKSRKLKQQREEEEGIRASIAES